MKKKSQKKTGAKKTDKPEEEIPETTSTAESFKAEEETKDAAPSPAVDDVTTAEGEQANDEADVPDLNVAKSHGRQPSLSVQSKMRSASFRQGSISGGPLSPSYLFSPEGDTAPDIYKKQQHKIEELEKENKRLAKEASDGERRWKKAEQDLEELREAEDDSTTQNRGPSADGGGSSEELAKLVRFCFFDAINSN
jgi:vacuolar-type H+-ATPase subunit I/STV1